MFRKFLSYLVTGLLISLLWLIVVGLAVWFWNAFVGVCHLGDLGCFSFDWDVLYV